MKPTTAKPPRQRVRKAVHLIGMNLVAVATVTATALFLSSDAVTYWWWAT